MSNFKEVYFHLYCQTCKHEKCKEEDEPCCDCLTEGRNVDSHKPIYWVEK